MNRKDVYNKATPLLDKITALRKDNPALSIYNAMQKLIDDNALFLFIQGDVFISLHMHSTGGFVVNNFIRTGTYEPSKNITIQGWDFYCCSQHTFEELRDLPFQWERFKYIDFNEITSFLDLIHEGVLKNDTTTVQ